MLMLPAQPAGVTPAGSPSIAHPGPNVETNAFDPTLAQCWLSRGRKPEHAEELARVWRRYPDLPASAPPGARMARGRERIAAMRPINEAISAQVEADRQTRNFAFTEARVTDDQAGERELAILRGRDEHGYDWDRAVAYADGWYTAHAGWTYKLRDTGWEKASREALRCAYDKGFAAGGGDTDDLFDAARRANSAALRAHNQPRQAAPKQPARPLPSSWPKPNDQARPARWPHRLLIVPQAAIEEVKPGRFRPIAASPAMAEALARNEADGLMVITLGPDGFEAGHDPDRCPEPFSASRATAIIADPSHGEILRRLLRGREIDDVLVALQGEYLRVLDAFAGSLPLCRTMERTKNSALQQRAHLQCWLDRGHTGRCNVGAGHIRWGKAIKGLVGKLGEFTARHTGAAPGRGHLVRIEVAGGQAAEGYVTSLGEALSTEIVVSNKAHLRREMTIALRAFGGATRLACLDQSRATRFPAAPRR